MEIANKTLSPLIFFRNLEFGLSIYVSGNIEILGNWDAKKALELKYLEKDIWYRVIASSIPFEYKFFINEFQQKNIEKIDKWETILNKTMDVKSPQRSTTDIKDLSVISFNIRFANPNDGENLWNYRKKPVGEMILKYSPDILGIQEGLNHQLEDLQAKIGDIYQMYAVKRGSDEGSNETCAIFFRKNRFLLLDKGTFWLSEIPDISGSMIYGSKLPRICSWVRLFDFYNEKMVYIFNTHLDHMSWKNRMKMTEILMEYIEKIKMNFNGNILLLGDFNARSDEECVKFVKKMLRDSCEDEKEYTFHGWT